MIRFRLLIGFVLVGLLPVLGVGVGTYILSYQNGKQQAIDRLESVSARKELAIQVWVQSLAQELELASQADVSPKLVINALSLSNDGVAYSWYNDLVRNRLQYFVNRSEDLQELFLIDLSGRVVVSTESSMESQFLINLVSSTEVDYSKFIRLPLFPISQEHSTSLISPLWNDSLALMLVPVSRSDGKILGYIGGRFKIDALRNILSEKTGLGETGMAYLVNPDFAFLFGRDQNGGENIFQKKSSDTHSSGIKVALAGTRNIKGVYKNPVGETVIGVYRWMPDLGIVLSVEQDTAEAFQLVIKNAIINVFLALGALIIAVVVALIMTRSIANPIINLANIASQIADGNLDRIAFSQRKDEIGELAKAFNTMTAQLRDLINSLEQRVSERTLDLQTVNEELQRRAIQLETSVKVAKDITSILNIDLLLQRVVEIIQEAFGYYHVQVFLLDKETNTLLLGASSGERSIQHRQLMVEKQSINTQAIKTGQIQLVNDIRQNPYYLFDEGLPETCSELVIPLQVGSKIIGTLDIHSTNVNSFNEKDLPVLKSLGDQIAIAIENARLYDQSRDLAILEERHRLARELHDSVTQSLYSLVLLTEGWRRKFDEKGDGDTKNYFIQIGEIASQALKEMRLLILELRPPTLEQEGLVGALQKRLDAVEQRVGIKARVVMEEFYDIPVSIEKDLYWIAQEALNNSLKHARATQVYVWIYLENSYLYLKISDDGIGFDDGEVRNRGGMGLVNMYERAMRMGGELSVDSAPNKGTTITVKVPYLGVSEKAIIDNH